jgi:uncharacterized damage-inducible protein DinB
MSAPTRPEIWLRGPLPGIDRVLMPAAHTLVQAREDIAAAAAGASEADLWARPVGRAALPGTVLGLIVHAAEHTSRHTGQFITMLKIARGLRAPRAA